MLSVGKMEIYVQWNLSIVHCVFFSTNLFFVWLIKVDNMFTQGNLPFELFLMDAWTCLRQKMSED